MSELRRKIELAILGRTAPKAAEQVMAVLAEEQPEAERLLRRLLQEGVVVVDDRYGEVSDAEGYRSVPATEEERAWLRRLRDGEVEGG